MEASVVTRHSHACTRLVSILNLHVAGAIVPERLEKRGLLLEVVRTWPFDIVKAHQMPRAVRYRCVICVVEEKLQGLLSAHAKADSRQRVGVQRQMRTRQSYLPDYHRDLGNPPEF